jgi:hypothetical protein
MQSCCIAILRGGSCVSSSKHRRISALRCMHCDPPSYVVLLSLQDQHRSHDAFSQYAYHRHKTVWASTNSPFPGHWARQPAIYLKAVQLCCIALVRCAQVQSGPSLRVYDNTTAPSSSHYTRKSHKPFWPARTPLVPVIGRGSVPSISKPCSSAALLSCVVVASFPAINTVASPHSGA